MRAQLVGPRGLHDLDGTRFVIGRSSECDLTLDDGQASRKHASITATEAGFVVRDLGSKNGTFVDGEQVTDLLLPDDTRISVGGTVLRFKRFKRIR